MKPRHSRAVRRASLALLTAAAVVAARAAFAVLPYYGDGTAQPAMPADPYDYAHYLFIKSGDCASGVATPDLQRYGFDCQSEWKFTDWREPPGLSQTFDPLVANNPQEFYGIKGAATNRAFEVSTGRPDVLIAVLDSGIKWQRAGDIRAVVKKLYLNRGELPMPQGGPNPKDTRFDGYDVNGDGVFNIDDYAHDSRVTDRNGNGILDPEDLILTFSDGRDDDNNGYVDDIAGWDFFENDNDPQDEVVYGHGTGEAHDSSAEAGLDNGTQCPNCMVIPLRVGDSFVADVNHFAEAVVYATDNGVSVIQEALGTLNHSSFGQAALDYADRKGVIVNASEADEAAGHHNWPAAYDKTMVVNSIRTPSLPTSRPYSYLYFNGCTNFGGYTYVAIPSTSCSSEATGRSAGISGLLQSAARNAHDRGDLGFYPGADFVLSSEELRQLWRLGADDIDFATPYPLHWFSDQKPADVQAPLGPPDNYVTTIPATVRYPTQPGWDFFTGYGRANNGRLLREIGLQGVAGFDDRLVGPAVLKAQDRIPPEARIETPRWWRQYGYRADHTLLIPDDPLLPDQLIVSGRAAANRVTAAGGTFDYVLEWAPQVQGGSTWFPINSASGLHGELNGELGRIGIAQIAQAQAAAAQAFNALTDPTSPYNPEQYGIRLRLRVIAHPANAADTINNEAVTQKQVDVYPARETVMRDDLGLHGKPSDGAGSPSFHDIDGDGRDELLLTTSDGLIHAYTDVEKGTELPGWPVHSLPLATPGLHGPGSNPDIPLTGNNAFTRGDVPHDYYGAFLLGSPAVADLDDDGRVEVIAADIEGHIYAWEPDGSLRAGFPLSVDYNLSRQPPCTAVTIPACDDYSSPPRRDHFNMRDWGINAPPAIGDVDPDYPGLEIVSGSNDGHVYVWHADGTPMPGWPVILRDPTKVAAMDPVTHFITYRSDANARYGTKILNTPALGDIDGDGKLDIVVGVNEEYVEDPNTGGFDPVMNAILQLNGALGLLGPGNGRVYALWNDGDRHPQSDAQKATPHLQDQAYKPGWPVKVAMLSTELLPYVGAGINTQPVLADTAGDGKLKIVVASAAGPGYIFNADGTPALGTDPTNGKTVTLADTVFGPLSIAKDTPSFVGVGALSIGSMDGGGHLTIAGTNAGLKRLLDLALEERQLDAEDQLALWNAGTGQFEPNAPIVVNDLQFLNAPIFADVDGDGKAEVIQGTAVNDLVVVGANTLDPSATRYHTGGWTVSSAAVGGGPLAGAAGGKLYIANVTREGYLRLFPTAVARDGKADCAALSQWPEAGHDAHRTGNYRHDGERPYPLRNVRVERSGSALTLHLLATGDDRYCGRAARYEARVEDSAAPGDWRAAAPLLAQTPQADAGAELSFNLPALPDGARRLLVRAYDAAGNGSALAVAEIPSGPVPTPVNLSVQVPDPATMSRSAGGTATVTVSVSNPGQSPAWLDSATLQLSNPQAFAEISLVAPNGQQATVSSPGANPVFNFNPALEVVAGGQLQLQARLTLRSSKSASRGSLWPIRAAQAADGRAAGSGGWLGVLLLFAALLLAPRRWALPLALLLGLLAGCGGGNRSLPQPPSTPPPCQGSGCGNPGGGTGGTDTVALQSLAAHAAGNAAVSVSGLPAALATVGP